MKTLKELLDNEIVSIAKLPPKNYFDVGNLSSLDGYTVPLTKDDYTAKTPLMWNTLYERLNLNIRNIMVVADPRNAKLIFDTLRQDPKYLGGGAGVGFKEVVIPYLDEVIPNDLKSVNIIVNNNRRLIGYNTDAEGFVRSLEEKFVDINKRLEDSNIVVFGAGGVAKEVIKLLVKKKVRRIVIANRTFSKAVEIASKFEGIAYGIPETMIRGAVLNSYEKPDAIINLTDKGSDGKLEEYSAFAHITNNPGDNLTISRSTLRELVLYTPDVIVADIVLTKNEKSITLRLAEAAGIKNLLDGKPMVVYQAGPAFKLIADAYPNSHKEIYSTEKIINLFREII